MKKLRLGINIDHVATLRNARGGVHPCPIQAAKQAKAAGADGITAHLREDRRHIKDADIVCLKNELKNEIDLPLNLEMAATDEMLAIALSVRPHAVCLVPEKREELTTEGGLNVIAQEEKLRPLVQRLQAAGSRVSLFVDPDISQIEAACRTGARAIELHTGTYAEHLRQSDIDALVQAAKYAQGRGLEVHAGHGLNYENVGKIAAIPEIEELNIGHFLIGEAVFVGLAQAIAQMRALMDASRQ